eukprot:CAMPEP_0206546752 /NCGR_PEP_ID=MMETSP0325_2-20121206/12905_1 /ASSEMBLY_ACC=CAM_ASM_000347 /TAXON_ID=2866 /ORGANISM="Crypthecodinium cohnii, Strain Seligo" /LENGTH=341 /DNA_ID=CAMNT_0054045961 /DNA_START=32 /DNA_END=1054 /DNA_ORIENTATION=+
MSADAVASNASPIDPHVGPERCELEARIHKALDRVLDEWLVTGIHRAAAQKFVKDKICAEAGKEDCLRVRQWLLLRMNGKVWDHGQALMCKSPDNIPELRALPVWPSESMSWLAEVSARHSEVLQELLESKAEGAKAFQPYRDPGSLGHLGRKPDDGLGVEGVDRGQWNVSYLFLNHKRFEDNCSRFPKTVQMISEVFPRHYSHAFFSALTPGSHILKHTGPSNRMLRVWLPLCGLDGFKLRVADQILEPKPGEAFAWDHSFEHEAWHEGEETRFVLIVDIWHPDLADPEVKFLSTLQNCRLRAGRAMLDQAIEEGLERKPEDCTYYEIVEKARHLLTDDE